MNCTLEELRHGVVVGHLFLSLAESFLFVCFSASSFSQNNKLTSSFFDSAFLVFVLGLVFVCFFLVSFL